MDMDHVTVSLIINVDFHINRQIKKKKNQNENEMGDKRARERLHRHCILEACGLLEDNAFTCMVKSNNNSLSYFHKLNFFSSSSHHDDDTDKVLPHTLE